jgi:hypothetical protein
MTVSLINDPSDFVPSPSKLEGKKWAKWFEGGEPNPSLVSECIDYSVDFVVKESARQRADRRWGMTETEEERVE